MTDAAHGDTRRPRNRRGQGDRLRTEILSAAAALLDERVSHPDLNLSLREVARATGIATQSLYLHFHSRESLAWAIAADGYHKVVAQMRTAERQNPGSGADSLRAQAHAFLQFARTNRGVFRLMFGHDVSQLDPRNPDHPGAELWRQWIDAIRQCESEGYVFAEGSPRAAQLVWSGLMGRVALAVTTFSREESGSLDDFADYLIDRLLAQSIPSGRPLHE
jgi:AcrR family transcriptional regulator